MPRFIRITEPNPSYSDALREAIKNLVFPLASEKAHLTLFRRRGSEKQGFLSACLRRLCFGYGLRRCYILREATMARILKRFLSVEATSVEEKS
jgi:hypothetical protein